MMTLQCYMKRRRLMLATDMHSNACLVQTQRKFLEVFNINYVWYDAKRVLHGISRSLESVTYL